MKTLLINNFSPYINNIIKVLNDLDRDFTCHDCNYISSLDHNYLAFLQNYDNIVLSGRQQNSTLINRVNSNVVKGCIRLDKPLLGICYGGQILALTLGCTLKKIERVYDIVQIDILKSTDFCYPVIKQWKCLKVIIFAYPNYLKILRYWVVLRICDNELFCHNKKPLFGTQFHPEKSGKHGRLLIENFLKL